MVGIIVTGAANGDTAVMVLAAIAGAALTSATEVLRATGRHPATPSTSSTT